MEQMVNQLRMADWLTFDEKRVAMNYEERGGAYEYSYVNQGLMPLEQVNMDLTIPNDQIGNMANGDSQIS